MYKISYELIERSTYICSPRDQKIYELINANVCLENPQLDVWQNIKSRPYPLEYLRNELRLYYTGSNDADDFEKVATMWSKLKTPNGTINSAYGYNILVKRFPGCNFTQFNWAIESLKKDKDSRQAVMFVSNPEYQYTENKDFVCTLSYHFIIRDNKLNLIVTRRSQDIHFGLTFDLPWDVSLMYVVIDSLKETYHDLTIGNYYLNCGSLHLYDRNLKIYQDFSTP